MRRITFIALALSLIAVACSSNGETETFSSDPQKELVDAIAASNMPRPDSRLDDQTAACVIQEIVDDFGVDGLAELGVTADNPDLEGGRVFATPDAGRRVVDAGMTCIDVSAAIVSFLPKGVELLDDTVECVADQFQTDTFRDLFAGLVVSGAQPEEILTTAGAQLPIAGLLLLCVSPEEILELGDLLP